MVKVVTDSACDLPTSLIQKLSIEVVPLKIRFDHEEFTDGVELSNADFWAKSATSEVLPATAAPSPGAFEVAFKSATDPGEAVVCINISSALSATYQAAVTAATAMPDVDVRVIDSMQCSVAQGSLVLAAARLAAQGASVDEVVAEVHSLRDRIQLIGTLDTLDNLKKGGRIGAASAFFASLLSVKPLITIKNGSVEALSRQRTRRKALAHLVELVSANAPLESVAISHAQAPDVDEVVSALTPLVDSPILLCDIGPVIGTHGGPRTIAVCYATKKGT